MNSISIPALPARARALPESGPATDGARDEALLDRAIDRIASTESGRELAQLLRQRRDRVVVVDPGDTRLPASSGGRWDPIAQQLLILRSELEHPAGATLLAHEAVHMRDSGSRTRTLARTIGEVGRVTLSMASAPFRLENPVSVAADGIVGAIRVGAEVDAYHLQAHVAQELGLAWPAIQHPDGTPRSRDELTTWLADNDQYRLTDGQRAAVGGTFALLGARVTSGIVNAIGSRVLPGSWTVTHARLASIGALTGWSMLVAHDILTHRQRR